MISDLTPIGRRARSTGVAAAVLIAICTASCSNETLTSPTSSTQLEGTWRLFQMTTGSTVHNEDLAASRFGVTFTTGRIEARADCNQCTGAATLSGATLTVNALACTRAACVSAPLDTRFSGLLTGALTVRINERLLQLNSSQGELRFER